MAEADIVEDDGLDWKSEVRFVPQKILVFAMRRLRYDVLFCVSAYPAPLPSLPSSTKNVAVKSIDSMKAIGTTYSVPRTKRGKS